MNMFFIRIFSVDFYMSPAIQGMDVMYNDFRGSSIHQVPIIRIFGTSESGHKTCLHIHGVFPYIYIPFEGCDQAKTVMYQVATTLDQAINTASGHASSTTQHIYKIALVSGIPFYGYHAKEHQFLKIYFYNPLLMKKACHLLQNGNILGKPYQLHEAHIPFVLQFMIDYNLHGMNYISLSEVYYRENSDIPEEHSSSELPLAKTISKTSACRIEADGLAEHIINRLEVTVGQVGKNPGIAALWEDEKQRRRNKNEDSQISQCLSQTRLNVPPTDSHIAFKSALKEKLSLKNNKTHSISQNASVYPAETPKAKDILSASFVETHSSTVSTSDADCVSTDCTPEINLLDATFSSNNLNNSDAKDLLEVLHELEDNVNVEVDSILSQISKYPDENDEECEIDMSLPLAATTTPTKIVVDKDIESYDNQRATNNRSENKADSENDLDVNSLSLSFQENQIDGMGEHRSYTQDNSAVIFDNSPPSTLEHLSDKVKRQLNFTEMDIVPLNKVAKINASKECVTSENSNNDGDAVSNSFEALTDINTGKLQTRSDQDFSMLPDIDASHKNHEAEVNKYSNLFSKAEEYDMDKNYVCIAGTSKQNENLKRQKVCSEKKEMSVLEFSASLPHNSQNSTPDSLTPYSKSSGHSIQYELINNQERTNDEESLCDTTKINPVIPLSQTFKFIRNLSFSGASSGCDREHTVNSYDKTILMPKFNPPSRKVIKLTLEEYDIPLKKYQKPFYSDFADVTGEIQIGYRVLKVGSVTSGLLDFKSYSVNQGLCEFRKLEIQKLHPNSQIKELTVKRAKLSLCDNVNCVLTPSKFPPSRQEVNLWLKVNKSKKKFITATPKREKLKILLPCSPGAESDSDIGDCITVSPFSPLNDSSPNSTINEGGLQQTPKSSLKSKKQKSINGKKICEKPQRKCRKTKSVRKYNNNENATCSVNSRYENESILCKSLLQSQFLNRIPNSSYDSCQITGVTPNNTHDFKMSLENLQQAKAVSEHQGLTILAMELHTQIRSDFKPDPQLDSIRAIFYSVFNDVPESCTQSTNVTGVIAVGFPSNDHQRNAPRFEGSAVTCDIIYVDSETTLVNEFAKFVKLWDPDICAGYEIEQLSWGYLIDRGSVLGINLQLLLARTPIKLSFTDDEFYSDLKLTGRVLLNVWRLMKHELALQSYTFENVMYHVLHVRIPLHSFKDLSFWWEHRSSIYWHKTVNFYLYRVKGILKLFDQLDLIGRTCELARLFGIQFYEVLSRGSQFRVESMMLRLAKPLNYIAVSPSVQQRAKMKAPEFLPLILEPESKYFTDPVIVLDFQSLYPSVIIAYNYCFSTCLGKVEHLGQNIAFEFGATQLKISNRILKRLLHKNVINFSPCGVAFVKAEVRRGILPRMLSEILETRLMVKKSMKQNKNDKLLQRILHSRQLGLKLIANVTYGYTAANFSGRMPAVEVGDSVVSKGRETLLRAIKLIESTPNWGAKVVYGDTDSVFVLVPGKSKECAFKIGAEIAEAVTNANPSPIKLKLEKVYHPCILQTKKRYVGYAYESVEQTEPEFCAKGIETVRRDGCPAVSKMLEKCLKILFDTNDASLVRKYVVRQFNKLLTGRVSLQDLTFAKEYRGASHYRPGACIPALELTKKWLAVDKRNEPRCGERVPYVIVNGPPGLPLIKLVRSPRELLSETALLPNVLYYITRVIIPPLNRCFTLIGIDLNTWFNSMPRKQMQILNNVTPDSKGRKGAISHYFSTTACLTCSKQTQNGLCVECCNSAQNTIAILQNKIRVLERSYTDVNRICESCCGHSTKSTCISLDCPVVYSITKTTNDFQQVSYMRQIVQDTLNVDI